MSMKRLKLTSPGILLISAVIAAAGIFLLDLFYLGPHVAARERPALREVFAKARRTVGMRVQSEVDGLAHVATALSSSPQAVRRLAAQAPPDEQDARNRRIVGPDQARWVWLGDGAGRVLRSFSGAASDDESRPGDRDGEIATVLSQLADCPAEQTEGLVTLGGDLAVFVRRVLRDPEHPSAADVWLWMVRPLDRSVMNELTSAIGGTLVFVPGENLQSGGHTSEAVSHTFWKAGDNRLIAAWMVHGPTGRALGYFQADLSVSHIHGQAVTARRMVLIALSLSLGLAILVIMGAHILIGGPIVRLLGRLQQIESGKGKAEDLARHLHGEPLMLARRLESAFEKLAHISKTDQLTNLANRRHFKEVLEHFYYQARRYNRPLSLAVMDVDFFKAVNDSAGHAAGDELLKLVAKAIEDACRKADLPARLGGDEFAVLFPETSASDAAIVAERIRQAICSHPIVVKSLQMNATISVGITDLNAGAIDSPSAMLALADRALYAAKELGRNRLTQACELDGVGWEAEGSGFQTDLLYTKVAGLNTQFKELMSKTVNEIVGVLSSRNSYLAAHSQKVRLYAALIAEEMELPDRVIKRIKVAAMLHDIGMLAMPDAILMKPDRLSEQEMDIVRKHPLLGVQIMEKMAVLEQEIPAVRYHHERYDGKGYPEGIREGEIPLTARILAVADAFDAMTSPAVWRTRRDRVEALEEIKRGAGTQFDPNVAEAFMAVAARLGDELMALTEPEGAGGPLPKRPARKAHAAKGEADKPAFRTPDALRTAPG